MKYKVLVSIAYNFRSLTVLLLSVENICNSTLHQNKYNPSVSIVVLLAPPQVPNQCSVCRKLRHLPVTVRYCQTLEHSR